MPIYKYECTEKGHNFNEMCSVSLRESDKKCPQCGALSKYKTTFSTNFQYGKDYKSTSADNHRWNLRENKRLGTRGKSYA